MQESSQIELPSYSYGENDMNQRILVAYASGLGSTVEIAMEIAKTLGTNGISVDVKPVRENPALDGYQAILVGSAVRHGHWLPEAVEFVEQNRQVLNNLPVALFCVHISNLGNDENSRCNRLVYLDEIRAILLNPIDEAYFAGKFDRRGAALLMPGLLARFVPPMDFRKWKRIRAWAESVGPQLLTQN
jgi:menaquinone-dependent protoporphyrinogen oxidase